MRLDYLWRRLFNKVFPENKLVFKYFLQVVTVVNHCKRGLRYAEHIHRYLFARKTNEVEGIEYKSVGIGTISVFLETYRYLHTIKTPVSHVLMLVFLVLTAKHFKCNIMFLN
jgi:hypothetical protein